MANIPVAGQGQQGGDDDAPVEIIPERFRIEDAEAWFQRNTLRDASSIPDETLDRRDERARLEEFKKYQEQLHETIFADEEAKEKHCQEERLKQLAGLKLGKIVFQAVEGNLDGLPLYPFAESCDTVFALATSYMSDQTETERLECRLEDFRMESVKKFVGLVLGTMSETDLDSDGVVDCCCIANYLQNHKILAMMESILSSSIDTANCLSICSLADQLQMPSLFEKSLRHMMQTLGDTNSYWQDLTPELRERIEVIKGAIQSSVHSQRSKLYFTSLEEYISIFAERVQYYKERLADAKDQLHLIDPGSKLWTDTQLKIHKQEQRVKTLSAALNEHKKLFCNKGKFSFSFSNRPERMTEKN